MDMTGIFMCIAFLLLIIGCVVMHLVTNPPENLPKLMTIIALFLWTFAGGFFACGLMIK